LNTTADTIVFGGGGSINPSLMMWSESDKISRPLIISQFNRGYSVYALAISPNGTRIAAGTKPGLLQVYGLLDFRLSKNSPPLFEIFHQSSIASLAFCTDDILASGGLDGKIKLWSVTEKRQVAEIKAHSNGVFALRQLGSLVLASIGGDNVLHVWDMDTLEAKFESDPLALPKTCALTSLDFNSANGLLLHPSRNGELHIYDSFNDFSKHRVSAHNGDFCALSCSSKYTITAGLEDAMIKLWASSTDELIAEASASLGILAVSWLGTETIMTAYTNGSGQIWKVDKELLTGQRFDNLDLRSVIGLPMDLAHRSQLNNNRQWRDKKLSQANEIIADSDNRSQITKITNELHRQGFSAEACLILADAAKAQNRPLWELESRLALVDGLGNDRAALPSLYALGKLLRKLKEPVLARDYFKQILIIDVNYSDTKEQIDSLQSDPLTHLCPEKDVRGDLEEKQQLLQELEKYSILDKEFFWRVIFKTGKTFSSKTRLDIKEIIDSITTDLNASDVSSVELRHASLFTGDGLRNIKWIYISSANEKMPIAFGLEISSNTRGFDFIPYGVFDTRLQSLPEDLSPKEHNQQVKAAWLKLQSSSDATSWLINIIKVQLKIISLLDSRNLSREDRVF